jgi:hypothetical protein
MVPSLTPWLPDSTGSMILAITRMTTPPLGATAPVRRSPAAHGPAEHPLVGIDQQKGISRALAPAAHTYVALYAGRHNLNRLPAALPGPAQIKIVSC